VQIANQEDHKEEDHKDHKDHKDLKDHKEEMISVDVLKNVELVQHLHVKLV